MEVVTKFFNDTGDGNEESSLPATPKDVDAQPVNSKGVSMQMEADLKELSNSINAKEGLIEKLLVTQEKFEVRLLCYAILAVMLWWFCHANLLSGTFCFELFRS
jgi:hypothetical protein